MSTTYDLTGNLTDLVGGSLLNASTIRARVDAWGSAHSGTTGDEAGQVRLGSYPITFTGGGAWSVTGLPATGPDMGWTPEVQGYRVVMEFIDPALLGTQSWSSDWFTLTENTDLVDIIVMVETAITSAATSAAVALAAQDAAEAARDAAAGHADDAEAAQAAAEAARDDAVDISGISTSDGVVEALVKNTGGAGPLTSAALNAVLAGFLSPVAFDTDDVPYLTDSAGQSGSPIQYDTDDVPYIALGA